EVLRIRARDVARIGIRNITAALVEIRQAAIVVHALEGEQQQLSARAQAVDQKAQALDKAAVDAAGARTSRIEKELALQVEHRMQQAVHARVDVDAGAGVARADEMHVAVPALRGIEAFPRGANQLVI